MNCDNCGNKDWNKFKEIERKDDLIVNFYTGDETEITYVKLECLECGHIIEFSA